MEVLPGGAAHSSLCPPAGPGHEDRHPVGPGGELQRRRRGHFLPQEPRRGETKAPSLTRGGGSVGVYFILSVTQILLTLKTRFLFLDSFKQNEEAANFTPLCIRRGAGRYRKVLLK